MWQRHQVTHTHTHTNTQRHATSLPLLFHVFMWQAALSCEHFWHIKVKKIHVTRKASAHAFSAGLALKHTRSHTCSINSQSSRPTKIISLGNRWRVPELLTRNHDVTLMLGPRVKIFLASLEETKTTKRTKKKRRRRKDEQEAFQLHFRTPEWLIKIQYRCLWTIVSQKSLCYESMLWCGA